MLSENPEYIKNSLRTWKISLFVLKLKRKGFNICFFSQKGTFVYTHLINLLNGIDLGVTSYFPSRKLRSSVCTPTENAHQIDDRTWK